MGSAAQVDELLGELPVRKEDGGQEVDLWGYAFPHRASFGRLPPVQEPGAPGNPFFRVGDSLGLNSKPFSNRGLRQKVILTNVANFADISA